MDLDNLSPLLLQKAATTVPISPTSTQRAHLVGIGTKKTLTMSSLHSPRQLRERVDQYVSGTAKTTSKADECKNDHDDTGQVMHPDTTEKAYQEPILPPLLRLPNEIMCLIFDAFPVDPRLPNLTVKAASTQCQNRFRQTTRLSLWALSVTCRALHVVSQQRLFSSIHIENGTRAGLLLRSLFEAPRLRTYIHQLDLRFSLDDGGECRSGLRECLDLDFSMIPNFHASIIKRLGILDHNDAVVTGPVELVFQTLVGLMLSLTTGLETLTLGFDVRHSRYQLEDTENGVENFLSLFSGVNTTCQVYEGLSICEDLPDLQRLSVSGDPTDSNDLVSGENNSHDNVGANTTQHHGHQMLPRLRSLDLHYQKTCFDVISHSVRPRLWPFNLPSLLALPSLLSLTTFFDTTQWGYLDQIEWPEKSFALEKLSFHCETMPGSALGCILRRCPKLKVLEIDLVCYEYESFELYMGFRGATENIRISNSIPNNCPGLRSLILRPKGNPRFFGRNEPNPNWLANMTELTDLQVDVSCLFRDPEDMIAADICDLLPSKLEKLNLYDMWMKDGRVASIGGWMDPGPDGYLLRNESGEVDASAEPFATMLNRLAMSRMAGNLAHLRTVSVQSPIFEWDTGNAAHELEQSFALAGMELNVIPFLAWPPPERVGVDKWSFRQGEKRRLRGQDVDQNLCA